MGENHISTGNCGEYFVAAELERRGFTVALPLSNVKDYDLLAIDRSTHKQIAVQVKTTRHRKKEWVLTKKNEDMSGKSVYYIFVSLAGLEQPEYHIVPSAVVAERIRSEHEKWLSSPGKDGQKHNDSSVRKFSDKEDAYLNKWEILI